MVLCFNPQTINSLTEMKIEPEIFCLSCSTTKLSLFLMVAFVISFTVFDMQALHLRPSLSPSPSSSLLLKSDIVSMLRESVTFLPLKDLRFSTTAMEGNTWFMSSLNDTYEEDEVEYLYFPSEASKGRLLCINGNSSDDGGENSYGLAWKESLPECAVYMEGLTYMSDTYYDYTNLWHGLSALAPFAGWYKRKGCETPSRWVLFHRGELRTGMGLWLQNLMEATFGEVNVEVFESGNGPYCFEKVVVMRHNLGKMGKERRFEVYDLFRCKARAYCNLTPDVETEADMAIRLTLLMRKGPRSFKNESEVVRIFSRECAEVKECKLTVAQSENLTFCNQVELMTSTDIVASPHGAQLTNMFFMDRNSSVMEFFPNGWLKWAGVGKYAHHWMASHSGMRHEGAWWDPEVAIECPENDQRCFGYYKNLQVGHNETYFAEWARNVINQVKIRKLEKLVSGQQQPDPSVCACA